MKRRRETEGNRPPSGGAGTIIEPPVIPPQRPAPRPAGPAGAQIDVQDVNLGSIDAKYAALGGVSGFLGAPLGGEQAVGIGRMRRFAGGLICWSPQWGAHEVHGAILSRYDQIAGPAGPLGFPRSDESSGTKASSRVNFFDNGGIFWSPGTGAHEVTERAFVRYLDLGGEAGMLGLPVMDQSRQGGATWQKFEGATLFTSDATGSFEVHGAIRDRYYALGGPGAFLGLPLSDETVVRGRNGAEIGRESRFVGGTIYWSAATGAFEVHGQIRDCYYSLGGPAGPLGFPITDETSTSIAATETRWNDFASGVIVWRPGGARAITSLRYYLGQVDSGQIDDGVTWTGRDRTAELITYTTIEVNGQSVESRVRRPSGHAGSAYNIGRTFDVTPVRHNTTVRVKIDVDDWDAASANDWLGTLDRTFTIADFWGLLGGAGGIYSDLPATSKGGDAPQLSTLRFDISVSDNTGLDTNAPYRKQRFWRFDNFSTPALSREQYAATFSDVENAATTWDKIVNPFDTAYYEIYRTIAAGGNCFGMSLESLYSLHDRSMFLAPLEQWVGTQGDAVDANAANILAAFRDPINEKHGYQLGASAIDWVIGSVCSLDSVRPMRVLSVINALRARHDEPVLCLNDLNAGVGHAVVPYGSPVRQADGKWRIYVADPNVVWREKAGDVSYVEIDPATDTFRYLPDGTAVQFQSEKIAGILPTTFLTAIPYSRLSTIPQTPFGEVLLAMTALLGLVLIVAGDGTARQVRVNGQDFYTLDQAGNRRIVPSAAGQMARIPLLDFAGRVPEVYVRRGDLDTVDLTLTSAAGGNHDTRLVSRRHIASYTGQADRGSQDQLAITGLRRGDASVRVTTSGPGKTSVVQLTRLAITGRPTRRPPHRFTARIELPVDPASPVTAALDVHDNVLIHGTGDRPAEVELTATRGGRISRAAFQLRGRAAAEQLRIVAPDPSDISRGLAVERLTGPGGSVVERFTPQLR